MKVVVLTNDAREIRREYDKAQPYFGTAPAALLEGLALLPGVEVHVVACWQKPMSAPAKLADNIWFHGLLVPKIGWLRTGYQGCIRAVRRKLLELQPDIVHGQGTERDCAISAVYSGFPNVLTIHGNMRVIARLNRVRPLSYYWFQARLESFTLPRTGGVICITRYTQEAVQDLAVQTWVLPNAVEGAFFHVRPHRASIPTILSVGVVSPRKNQVEFIKALDPLAKDRAFKLRFIGDAPADDYSTEFLATVRARDWCEHQGFLGREALRKEMASASIVALPSLEDNCPMVVLEAAAAGVPVVAAEVGGVPDLIQDGITGLLCDPTAQSSMRMQVERLLADPDLGARLASQARESAERRFHPRVIAARHVEIYEEVLATRS